MSWCKPSELPSDKVRERGAHRKRRGGTRSRCARDLHRSGANRASGRGDEVRPQLETVAVIVIDQFVLVIRVDKRYVELVSRRHRGIRSQVDAYLTGLGASERREVDVQVRGVVRLVIDARAPDEYIVVGDHAERRGERE